MAYKRPPLHHEFQRWIKLIFRITLLCACFLFLHDGFAQRVETKPDVYTFNMLQAHNNTWGYDIYVNAKLKIHQPSIPGMSGEAGFKSKERAERVARFVIRKMKNGEMPPTVTKQDLQKLNAL